MKTITKKQIFKIMRSAMGWGDAKRKLCEAIGVEYSWHYELPDYVLKAVKDYRGL